MRRRQGRRRWLREKELAEIWRRVAAGEPTREIAAAVDCSMRTVEEVVWRAGGIVPRRFVGPPRARSPLRLRASEREEISRGLRAGEPLRRIAARLGRAPSTVSREVARNGGRPGYRAWRATAAATDRARRPKVARLARSPRLRAEVERLLGLRWSPQQIAQRLRRYLLLAALPAGRSAPAVRDALAERIATLPGQLRRSLTWDRGKEMAEHLAFTVESGVAVYFCDPHSPWQRGTNENTNGLLRQYLPKGADLSGLTQADLYAIAAELNGRPRQTLGLMTPSEALAEAVASTG